jgi:hypothetical protein
MDREAVIRMAREAGMQLAWIATVPGTNKMKVLCDFDQVQHFAALVAKHEREECAKVCDVLAVHPEYTSDITKVAAQAIRARGEK